MNILRTNSIFSIIKTTNWKERHGEYQTKMTTSNDAYWSIWDEHDKWIKAQTELLNNNGTSPLGIWLQILSLPLGSWKELQAANYMDRLVYLNPTTQTCISMWPHHMDLSARKLPRVKPIHIPITSRSNWLWKNLRFLTKIKIF